MALLRSRFCLEPRMSDTLKGTLAMVLCCTVWGLSGIYYKLLAHIPTAEVLAHRTLWSFVFFGIVVVLTGRLPRVKEALSNRRTVMLLTGSAILVSSNWFVFIYSIQSGRAVEASLGYYIFPLVAVALGMIVFRERLGWAQWVAIALACVAVLTLTIGLGTAPYISLILATTFGLYGVLKKQVGTGPITSVTLEVMLIAPIALAWLAWIGGGVYGSNLTESALLMFSGILTGGPLILFAYAAQRLAYASIGIIQYLNPTLQFTVAVALFGEVFTVFHAIAFALIWTGLAIYSSQSVLQERAARKRAITEAGVS